MMERRKVLLIDDEEEFVATLAERLQLRGMVARAVTDPAQALERLFDLEPDVVVLDVMMPGMSGLELLRQVKAARPDLPVIMLTGHGSTKDGIEGMRLGAFDYLVKPVDIGELVDKMRLALAGSA